MARQRLDIDDIRTVLELIGTKAQPQTQTVVPTTQVPTQDSFEKFTGGVMRGWPFLLAMSSVAFWVVQSIFGINAQLAAQDTRITDNTTAITAIEQDLKTLGTDNNEIIRRLDNLQKDVEIIKSK